MTRFFALCNDQHDHSGIAMRTPAMVHYGTAATVLEQRQRASDAAYAAHPERFVMAPPAPQPVPSLVWINPPEARFATAGARPIPSHPITAEER